MIKHDFSICLPHNHELNLVHKEFPELVSHPSIDLSISFEFIDLGNYTAMRSYFCISFKIKALRLSYRIQIVKVTQESFIAMILKLLCLL